MAVVTLAQLRSRVRQRADQENSDFIADAELDNLININKRELDDLLIKSYGPEYFASSVSFSATASGSYSLSTLTTGTFYKLLGVDAPGSDGPYEVKPYNWHDRNEAARVSAFYPTVGQPYRYRIVGGNLTIKPAPASPVSMTIHWVPQQTALSLTTDSFDDVGGWSEYIVVNCAIAIKDKGEEDTSVLQADRARLKERIEMMAENRDASEPETVADVRGLYPWDPAGRGF
jgi:hypothetical protein